MALNERRLQMKFPASEMTEIGTHKTGINDRQESKRHILTLQTFERDS